MKHFAVYDKTSGVISRVGTCHDDLLLAQASGTNEAVLDTVDGRIDPNINAVNVATLTIVPNPNPMPAPDVSKLFKGS